ncbi:MAG: hypothetical protein P1P86_03040 [Bacteroidales bacterium]|nr:hypothetical protein [Bacteroidales bacterium]
MEKYYCDSSVKSDAQWRHLLDLALEGADTVEFNALSKDYKSSLAEVLPGEPYEIIKTREGKIYQSGDIIRFHLSENVKQFLLKKEYANWKNYFIEDVCLISKGKEILSTVSHEHYIIMPLSEAQRQELNNEGFSFDFEWVT